MHYRKFAVIMVLVMVVIALLLPVATYAQTTVDGSVTSSALAYPNATQSFVAHDLMWIFYQDGAADPRDLKFQNSNDNGVTWGNETTVNSDLLNASWDTWFDGTYVYYTISQSSDGSEIFRRGTPNADGSITWTAEQDLGNIGTYPTIAVDTSGYAWIAYYVSYGMVYAKKNANNDGTWSTARTDKIDGDACYFRPTILPLTSGRMVCIWNSCAANGFALRASRWTGAAWGTIKTSSSSYPCNEGRYNAINQDDYIHVTWLEKDSYEINYLRYNYSINDWDSFQRIDLTTDGTIPPAILRYTVNNDLYVFWGSNSDDDIYYRKYQSSNSTWMSEVKLVDETPMDGLTTGWTFTPQINPEIRQVGLYYVAGSTILKYKDVQEQVSITTLDPSGVTAYSATLRGEITSLGTGSVSERGFYYNTTESMDGAIHVQQLGNYGTGVYNAVITGLEGSLLYYVRAYAVDSYGTTYGSWVAFTTSELDAIPINFTAIPISSSQINVSWEWYPNPSPIVRLEIFYSEGDYPETRMDGTLIYTGFGNDTSATGLEAGTSYYFRGWPYDTETTMYSSTYVEDWATTFGGTGGLDEPDVPAEWFQDPLCTAYSAVPLLWDAIEATNEGFGFPLVTLCVLFTVLWISVLSIGVGGVMLKSGMWTMMISAILILICAMATLLPLWMIAIAIFVGGLPIYNWRRT